MMRMFLLLALLCVVVSGQTVTRQGYTNGTQTPGGCMSMNMNVNDTQTYPLGVCINTTAVGDVVPNSMIINECASNGLISASLFNGSATCDLAFASKLTPVISQINGVPFCNADHGNIYATWTCSSVPYPVTSPGTLSVLAYPFAAPLNSTNSATNNCDPKLAPTMLPFQFVLGACNKIQTLTASFGLIPSCNQGQVTATFYDTQDCTVTYSNITNSLTNQFIVPIGPYAQTGHAVAGVAPAALGSDCGLVPNFSFMNFTCAITTSTATTAAPTTPAPTPGAPTTPAPTTPAPTKSPNTASTVMYGIAALVVPFLAIMFA